ncbi:MAG TPA: cytochrome c-type biogenesis protein CcmH [Anaerolineales bacterium]|jgi:cytochrome c-type biogenesis protein CcmH|nr:cytochrome c-type biogenesis protein CcmH [Anaerolineales bacterium]
MCQQKFLRVTYYKLLLGAIAALALSFLSSVALAQGPTPTDDEVNRIAKQLYCPVCESTPLDACPTEACRQWRDLIRTMLAEGKSEAEIKQYFVDHYGVRVLAEPPNRLATYLIPAIAILLGALLLFRGFQMWMKPSKARVAVKTAQTSAPDPYVARLEEELKKQK